MYSSINCDCCGTCTDITRDSWKHLDSKIATTDAPQKHLGSKGCDKEHEGDDAYKAVQTKIVSRTWYVRLLDAGAGATLTLVALWLVLVSAATAEVILCA